MPRKLLAARADLVEELSKIAKSRNQTVYGFLNNILEQALKLHKMDARIEDVVNSYMVAKNLKNLGFIPLPEDLAYKALDGVVKSKNVVSSFFKLGEWYGKVLGAQLPNFKPVDLLRTVISEVAWTASEVSITENHGEITIRCIGPRFSESYTLVLASMFEGLAASMGFKAIKRYVTRGVISLNLKSEVNR
ncbi:hypothetical protein KEJ25_08860 [Candidatus Bathyarchaeota archaeon]|nr:hypothetical protein [Candidatus Bathyarchaeota archaeon]